MWLNRCYTVDLLRNNDYLSLWDAIFVKTYPVAVLIWAVLRLVVKRHIFRINRKGYMMHPYFIALQCSRDRSPMFLTSGVKHLYRLFRLTQYLSAAGHYMVSKLKNVCMYFVRFDLRLSCFHQLTQPTLILFIFCQCTCMCFLQNKAVFLICTLCV